jgi:hypothetical protein
MLPIATPERKESLTAQFNSNIQNLAYLTCTEIVRREQLARKLGYTKWLPPGTPLLEVVSLSADEIKNRGLQTSPAGETRSQSFTLRNSDPASLADVHIEVKPTLEKTRMALLLPNDFSSSARDFRICEQPYGDACVAGIGGVRRSHFKFARSNVFVELGGPTEEVGRLAAWLDKSLQEQIAASGKVVKAAQKPVIVLEGVLPARPQEAEPAKIWAPHRDEDVLVIEEPRLSDNLGAIVPDGTKTVAVRIRVLDPRVNKVLVSDGSENKILEPVNGQVTATFSLVDSFAAITAQAHTEPQGQLNGIIGVQSIDVMTESYHRALHDMMVADAPKK